MEPYESVAHNNIINIIYHLCIKYNNNDKIKFIVSLIIINCNIYYKPIHGD